MYIINNKNFTIYFGNHEQSISLEEIDAQLNTENMQFAAEQLQARHIAFLKQEHGVQGKIIKLHDEQNYYFSPVGDYLITQKKDCAIGVVTADCLPIVIYDPVTHTAGIVHAGWKGLVANIFEIAVQQLVNEFGSVPENLQLFLGPAARPCCYEVQQDFVEQFCLKYPELLERAEHEIFIKKDGKIFFDSRSFVQLIARNLGIRHENLYTRYNVCTICDLSFCSYRREQSKARRQISMISLR